MLILAIESSCDETAAAVVKNGREVLSNVIHSQIDVHRRYGGVVPEIASRHHIEKISYVIDEAVECASISLSEIDAVAVTYTPGLVGALLVGVSVAKGLAFALKKPLIAVNHIHGHICANYIANTDLTPPFVCMVASGGHSHIVYVKDYTEYEILARTRDDAAGEAFDKVARVLGLGYPGGPAVQKCAENGNAEAIKFPQVKMSDGSFDFSFSGVKTALINYVHNCEQRQLPLTSPQDKGMIDDAHKKEAINKEDIAASFQYAVVNVLCERLIETAKVRGTDSIALAGGVASNSVLRDMVKLRAKEEGFKFYCPPVELCTDNAAMIGSSAYYEWESGNIADMSLNAAASGTH